MIERRGLLITVLAVVIGGLLSIWLYVRFRIVFFFLFIPIFTIGGSLFRNLRRPNDLRSQDPGSRNHRSQDLEVKKDDYSVHPDEDGKQ
jgi:hypothetical protein